MSAALGKAIRERFAAAVAWARGAEQPEQVHALLARARGPKDGVPWLAMYGSDDPAGPFLNPTQAAELSAELDAIEGRLDALAADAADTVRAFAAQLIADANDRAEVLDDPRTARAATSGDASLDALLAGAANGLPKATTVDREDARSGPIRVETALVHAGSWWPGDVAPDEVLDWLARDADLRAAVAVWRENVAGGVAPGVPDFKLVWNDGERDRGAITFAGAAVLYSAERAVRAAPTRGAAVDWFLSDASPATTTTLQLLAGVNVAEHGRREVRETARNIPTTAGFVSIQWTRKPQRGARSPERTVLQLSLPGCDLSVFDLILSALRENYGGEAVLALKGVAALHHWQGKRAGETVFLYPEELAEATGRTADKDFRKRLKATLDAFGSCRMVARYPGGEAIDGPLVGSWAHKGGSRLRAYEVKLHPALCRGVRDEDGRAGNQWALNRAELLRSAGEGGKWRAAMLPDVLGPSFRMTRDDPQANFTEAELAERLGFHKRDDRYRDERQLAGVRELVALAVECGYLEPATKAKGAAVLYRIGPEGRRIMQTGDVPRVARLPETGADLSRWLEGVRERKGWTVEESATRLGVERTALFRARTTTTPMAALPPDIRAAFRRLLRPGLLR